MMETKKPSPTRVGNGADFQSADTRKVVPLTQNRNATDLARLRAYQNFGLELARRGEMNVSQFVATFIDFPEPVQAELMERLVDFTRVPIEKYEAAGAIRFPRRFIPLQGDRR